ncbi:hypothetical protein ACI495_004421 [Vibrio vulnificus]|nr:hypothetical protein [Vibrio vulnificus]
MNNPDSMELLEAAKGLAACGSEAASSWQQNHLATLFVEIERKVELALKGLERDPSI